MGNTLNGAMNVDSFRQNLENGKLPFKHSISTNGLFNEYYFNDGGKKTKELCSVHYSCATCENPSTNKTENYVAASLHSVKNNFEIFKF
jgi:Ca-activated chloride channel homolog